MGTALSGVKHIVASFFDFLFAGLTASPYLEDYYTRLSHGDRDFDDSFLWESAEAKPNLLKAPNAVVEEITPAIGTEIRGIQLSSFSPAQLDELALLAAERGVVVFQDQDFSEAGPEHWKAYGKHFGPLHVHQMGGQVKDHPEILPVYRDFTAGAVDNEIKDNVTSVKWHSDMSYEINGMGTTTFFVLSTPPSGGDTLYLSTTAAYDHLSESFRSKLHGLHALHSGYDQASVHDHRDRYIREPIETEHPVIRLHPVTKQYGLYVNRLYTKRIVGWKREESDAMLNFLFDHIERGQDWHIRVHWRPGTVVVYDNRVTQHSALRDFRVEEGKTRRHMIRITPQAERPVLGRSAGTGQTEQ
ncbi:putative alpha-ketoglutarate-dependent taurine dioxygenase protein [Neofusicoccum parvum]|uniref:Alpha-ketoglutarate-dependent taurine dioxygenase protein n=2 Tax=Neofusicoccum parvum TaxID=310453 RepID=A0ACB5S4A3_9PEZI|nr:putative alpha-ketoglutarate-dependent taurine dioxygenase protein [Neofusicoccum parvum UCRNP2]GME27506.1 putative alpha-ketoglutarate-dependent taurine dioxygenase protein [Neofusicoccum parvum]GME64287.1 putative alpha-ketoglutarate-dependent taurine dioxygenase protein [Neofusicoccum parvum]